MTIDVNNESGVEVDAEQLVDLSRFVLSQLGIHPLAELSLLLIDAEAMSILHEKWMDEPGPTDVLSFPMDELRPNLGNSEPEADPAVAGLLGDVVICPQVAQAQAASAGHPSEDEINLLCTHGILHLLGYDHEEPDEQAQMFGLQQKLLDEWQASRA